MRYLPLTPFDLVFKIANFDQNHLKLHRYLKKCDPNVILSLAPKFHLIWRIYKPKTKKLSSIFQNFEKQPWKHKKLPRVLSLTLILTLTLTLTKKLTLTLN